MVDVILTLLVLLKFLEYLHNARIQSIAYQRFHMFNPFLKRLFLLLQK